MKIIKFLYFINLVLFGSFFIQAQTTAIPDSIFEDYLETHDANGNFVGFPSPFSLGDGIEENGLVSTNKITVVTSLSISDLNIQDFTGLEDFSSLTSLTLINNEAPNLVLNFNGSPSLQDITILGAPNLSGFVVSQVTTLQNVTLAPGHFSDTDPSLNLDFSNNSNLVSLFVRFGKVKEVLFSGNNTNLQSIDVADNELNYLDLSNVNNLTSLNASGNELFSTNLQNGNNNSLTSIELRGNPNLSCILVDNISFAESQVDWLKDNTASYIENYVPVNLTFDANDDFVFDDGSGNQFDVTSWFDSNGGAIISDPSDPCIQYNWTYTYHVTQSIDGNNELTLNYGASFKVTDSFGNTQTTDANFEIRGIKHFDDEIYGTGETICEDEYDLNIVVTGIQPTADLNGDNITSVSFERVPNFEFNEGPLGTTFLGTKVDFPDTGAGSYSYLFRVTINKSIPIYQPESDTFDFTSREEEALITLNDKTVAFDVNGPSSFADCGSFSSIQDLTDLLEITPDPNIFPPQNPVDLNQYWSSSTYTGSGTYTFDPTLAFPNCPSNSVSITITQFSPSQMLPIIDPNFEDYLITSGIDSNPTPDGQIMASDVCSTTSLDIISYDIEDFSGLEYFKNLNSFSLINDQATSITGLDFSENKNLTSVLIINCPQVPSVDVTQNIKLEELSVVTRGNVFSTIDVSNNANLTLLQLADNQLTALDVSNNPNLDYLSVAINPIESIDVSNLFSLRIFDGYESALDVLDLSNNLLLESVNCRDSQLSTVAINNGNNSGLSLLWLFGNSELGCIVVDDVSFAESQVDWLKDASANYVTNSEVFFVVDEPEESIEVFYDVNGDYWPVIESWLDNNCNASVSSCTDVQWEYNYSFSETDFFITDGEVWLYFNLTATDSFGSQFAYEPLVRFVSFPTAGETNQGDGVVCGRSSNLNGINGTNFFNTIFNNSTVSISGDGTIDQNTFDVDFPDTGAGSFDYSYSISVTTPVQLGGQLVEINTSASWNLPNVTIPFDPGEDKSISICQGESLTLMDLYDLFDIVDGTDAPEFNPDDFWFDTGGTPITSYSGTGDYIFNAEAFLPDCGGIPATVTVIEEDQLSAGVNGTLEIQVGQTVTESQLFNALGGSPDPGGVWSPALAGPGTYTYTHLAGVCQESFAQVVVTEETLSNTSFDIEELVLVPNPTKDTFSLMGNASKLVEVLKIYDLNGKQLIEVRDRFEKINIQDLESALYFVHLLSKEGIKVVKLIKE